MSPTRVLLPAGYSSQLNETEFGSEQRKVLFFDQRVERWSSQSRVHALPERPWSGLLYWVLVSGEGAQ